MEEILNDISSQIVNACPRSVGGKINSYKIQTGLKQHSERAFQF